MNKRDRTPERQIMIDVQCICVRMCMIFSSKCISTFVCYGYVSMPNAVWCVPVCGCKHACFYCVFPAVRMCVCRYVCVCVCVCDQVSVHAVYVSVSLWL